MSIRNIDISENLMPQKSPVIFTIYKDANKQFRWRAKRGGRIIANCGEGYKRKESLLKTLTNFIFALSDESGVVKVKDTTRTW